MAQQQQAILKVVNATQEITEDSFSAENPAERRKFSRRAARWSSVITTRDKRMIQCRSLDVSERGVSLSSPIDFKSKTLFVLEMTAVYKGKKTQMRFLSEVRHTSIAKDGFTLGLYFKDATETAFEFLKQYANKTI